MRAVARCEQLARDTHVIALKAYVGTAVAARPLLPIADDTFALTAGLRIGKDETCLSLCRRAHDATRAARLALLYCRNAAAGAKLAASDGMFGVVTKPRMRRSRVAQRHPRIVLSQVPTRTSRPSSKRLLASYADTVYTVYAECLEMKTIAESVLVFVAKEFGTISDV